MPDADDFDVEYFRKLLRGGDDTAQPEAPAPPAKSSAARTRNKKKPAVRGLKKPKPPRKR
jgi:hypothetical protein